MTEKERLDKDELVTGFIDGQLTPRQMTEIKRLLAHDPNLQKELEAQQQQRQLLQSLPVESAPVLMAEEIRSILERRLILADTAQRVDKNEVWGLRLRKVAAAAAMILLPLMILGGVVYTIVRPSEVTQEPLNGTAMVKPQPAAGPLFSAVLQFQTRQPVSANDYIEKKIHTLGLMNFTTLQRQSDRTSYKVVCSRRYIEGLVGELEELWPKCERASYALLDTTTSQPVCVESIDPRQTLAMIRLTDITSATKLAQDFTQQNTQKTAASQKSPDTAQPILPKETKPLLAWEESRQKISTDEPDTICLVIEVLGQ